LTEKFVSLDYQQVYHHSDYNHFIYLYSQPLNKKEEKKEKVEYEKRQESMMNTFAHSD